MKNNQTVVLAAVRHKGLALEYASKEMKSNQKVVAAAVQEDGFALRCASEEMKNNETVVLAAVQQFVRALVFASEEMKNNQTVVLAAVRHKGLALEYASKEMKNNQTVVLAAVQQKGLALEYASEEMKNNENIVLAAVQQETKPLRYASEEIQKRIRNAAEQFGCRDVREYSQAMLHPLVVQVQVSNESCAHDLGLTCHNMGGELLAAVTLQREDDANMLHHKITNAVNPPHGPASLNLVLPGGQLLRDLDRECNIHNAISRSVP